MKTPPRLLAHWTLSLCALGLLGCQSGALAPHTPEPPAFVYRLGAGDRIRIAVWGEAKLEREQDLGPGGTIAYPLAGVLVLKGRTLQEASGLLAAGLKKGYRDPVVTVSLVADRSHRVLISGEVRAPGPQPFRQGDTVLSAIQAAGGLRPTAEPQGLRLVRGRNGKPSASRVDLSAILAGERPDVWLAPGDSIHVPPRLLARWNRWWRMAFPWSDPVDEGR